MKTIGLTVFFLIIYAFVFAQLPADSKNNDIISKYRNINDSYQNGKITQAEFVVQIEQLIFKSVKQGKVLSPDKLLPLLEPFREVIWKSNKYQNLRIKYYYVLMNNADILGLGGEAIFYADKFEAQSWANGQNPGLAVPYMKVGFYMDNGNFDKAIEVYESNKKSFEDYAATANTDPSGEVLLHTIEYGREIVKSLIHINKIENAKVLCSKINQIYDDFLKNHKQPSISNIYTSHYYCMNNDINMATGNYSDLNNTLTKFDILLMEKDSIYTLYKPYFEFQNNQFWFEYYLKLKEYKKAQTYLNKLSEDGSPYSDYPTRINLLKATLLSSENKYREAYSYIDTSFIYTKAKMASLSNQVIQFSYAKAKSEFNDFQLIAAQKSKAKLTNTIIIMSSLAIIFITLIPFWIRKIKVTARKKYAHLQNLVEVEIENAKREEREVLARELHDDHSNALASLGIQLEEILQNPDTGLKESTQHNLKEVKNLIDSTYDLVREKSHGLYKKTPSGTVDFLEKNITQMLEFLSSKTDIKKEISIDYQAINILPLNYQIEILRIAQECLTNILKHGQKSKEVFVFLYLENTTIKLEIGNIIDSKKTIKFNNKKGIGLSSLEKRVKGLNGILTIDYTDGIIVHSSIPAP
jgi:signal transduction histidine kinase